MAEPDEFDFARALSAAQYALMRSSPFFGALALFARTLPSESVPTAATDGKDLFINVGFLRGLTPAQRAGLLLHEVLHAALLHVPRRGGRDALRWNIAADIVVNGIVVNEVGLEIPPGAVRDKTLEHLSVEVVYTALLTDPQWQTMLETFTLTLADLPGEGVGGEQSGELGAERRAALEAHWREARAQAEAIGRLRGRGNAPAGLARELEALHAAAIDWRAYLWRFLVQTPNDFQDFDRRMIARGYYFETLAGEAVRVAVAVDTSGSVGRDEMTALLSEVQGMLGAYPHLRCDLYFADAALYGPYALTAHDDLPAPIGGGGTNFRPFFAAVTTAVEAGDGPAACVYLTDGYGWFPNEAPPIPTLWVLTSGGLALADLPFGDAVRLDLAAG